MRLAPYGTRSELRIDAKSRIETPARGCHSGPSATTASAATEERARLVTRREDRHLGSTPMDPRRHSLSKGPFRLRP